MPYGTTRERRALAKEIHRIWSSASTFIDEGVGESGKILQRLYRLAGRARSPFLRERCASDVIRDPTLAERVADYIRHTGTAAEFWRFSRSLFEHPEQVYPDVTLTLVEALLRLEPEDTEAAEILQFAKELLRMPDRFRDGGFCAAVAPLLLLRFGNGRSLRPLKRSFSDETRIDILPPRVVRSCAIVYASQGPAQLSALEEAAARLLRNRLAEIVRLLRRLMAESSVPDRYKRRLALRQDSLTGTYYVDMRTILTARLLRLNERPAVQRWVRDWQAQANTKGISAYDKALLGRLLK